jgi:sodium/hydrogen exchanger-like protein 6/7/sodium/hydrogen exchanger 8
MLLYSSTICATDSVAALTMLNSDKYPKLFSVVFGEGMVNDAVSIILFKAITDMIEDSDKSFVWYTPFELLGSFLKNCVLSVLVGITVGIQCKHI